MSRHLVPKTLSLSLCLVAIGAMAPRCDGEDDGPACVTVAPGQYGDCDGDLGFAFDGTSCVAVTGCDCEPDCGAFFADLRSCQDACHLPIGPGVGEVCASPPAPRCDRGLVCCYPCGIAGCDNTCEEPCDPSDSACSDNGCWMHP